jgi:NTP pyrophosphatase (non-canonical NTP hydrolase)
MILMDDKTYVQNAVKTAAPTDKFKPRLKVKPMNDLMIHLKNFQKMTETIDQYKKGLVYGKEVEILKQYEDSQELAIGEDYANLIHGVLGIVTEAGEISELLTKGINIDKVNLQEEIGDILWYIALICDTYGFDLSEIKKRNIEKLAKRYPNLFTEHDAINRDLTGERKVLEQ